MSIETVHNPLIRATGIRQSYGGVEVLHGVDVSVKPNTLTVISGPSGSGKSTLLNILSGIKRPVDGEVLYTGNGEPTDITTLQDDKLNEFLSKHAGFMPQMPNLINMTVAENIWMPYRLAQRKTKKQWNEREAAFEPIAETLGIKGLLGRNALTLSGGQQQRVSLARVLVRQPDIIFADEPSASLDTESKRDLHELLQATKKLSSTVLMVSHDPMSQEYADQIIRIQDGNIKNDIVVK